MRRLKGLVWIARGWPRCRRPPAALLTSTGRKFRHCAVTGSAMERLSPFTPVKFLRVCPVRRFWDKQGFQFEAFRPQVMDVDKPLPHIRLDAALEFLIGDKLR